MMNQFELDDRCVDYFQTALGAGGLLAKHVSTRATRRLFALVPEMVPEEHIYDPARGGLGLYSPAGHRAEMADRDLLHLVGEIKATKKEFVVFENDLARASEFRDRPTDHVVFNGDDVYHVLNVITLAGDPDAGLTQLRAAASASGLRGFVVRLRESMARGGGGHWSADDMQEMANSVRMAFISAYDGESYLVGEYSPSFE
jgi:hypothetical protein